jgi:general secretion pathway protein D
MRRRLAGGLGALLLLTLGCSSFGTYREAQVAEKLGHWDDAVLRYLDLVDQHPNNLEYRTALTRAKIRASQVHFEDAKRFHEAGALDRALLEYRQAVALDPTNQYAMVEMTKVREDLRLRSLGEGELQTIEEMKREARRRSQPPLLEPRSHDPISLEFPRAVPVKDIYRALGKAFGINILFDPNLRDQEIAIELKDVTSQDALEIVMRAAQHFYKVLDEHTILIAADTPQNRRAYEDQVIQSFFLSNAEVKDVLTTLRTMVDAKKVAANDQLNAIIMRDSADRVRVAEKIVETIDKAKAEVVVDVELLQVNSSKLRELGMSLSSYTVGQSLDFGENATIRWADLENITMQNWAFTIPSFLYSFVKNDTDSQVLAQPQLRITEGETGSLHIGDRVPIPTTSFNANNVGGNQGIIPITSFQYTDIGIKVNIEPRVHHNLEISLKLKVEVSNISGFVEGSQGQEQPTIGTRNIETVIRLKDGETNFLAGLLRTDETNSDAGVPGLSEIPVLGRLFSKTTTNKQRTDVILTLTPHIIRRSDITAEDLTAIWVGTEQNISYHGGSPRLDSEVEGPFDEGTSSAERVRELIRQRVQELPRGLQGDTGDAQQAPEPSPGRELAPSGGLPPSGIFGDEEETEEEEEPTGFGVPDGDGRAALEPAPDAASDIRLASTTLAGGAAAVDAGGIRLRVTPQALAVVPGDRFTVRIEALAGIPAAHLPLTVRFDPERLALRGWRRGDLLGGEGEAQVLAAERAPGEVVIGASRLGDAPPVEGRGAVVSLELEALAGGRSRIEISEARALDAELLPVGPVRLEAAEIVIGDSPMPRPDVPERPRPHSRPEI